MEQESPDGILTHRSDAMAQHKPTGFRFNRRSTISNLNEFPRESCLKNQLFAIPKVKHVGIHQEDVLMVLAREHRIMAAEFSREKSEPFVPDLGPIECADPEVQKVFRLQQLR